MRIAETVYRAKIARNEEFPLWWDLRDERELSYGKKEDILDRWKNICKH